MSDVGKSSAACIGRTNLNTRLSGQFQTARPDPGHGIPRPALRYTENPGTGLSARPAPVCAKTENTHVSVLKAKRRMAIFSCNDQTVVVCVQPGKRRTDRAARTWREATRLTITHGLAFHVAIISNCSSVMTHALSGSARVAMLSCRMKSSALDRDLSRSVLCSPARKTRERLASRQKQNPLLTDGWPGAEKRIRPWLTETQYVFRPSAAGFRQGQEHCPRP